MIERIRFDDKKGQKAEFIINEGWLWVWLDNLHGNPRCILTARLTREMRDELVKVLQEAELG